MDANFLFLERTVELNERIDAADGVNRPVADGPKAPLATSLPFPRRTDVGMSEDTFFGTGGLLLRFSSTESNAGLFDLFMLLELPLLADFTDSAEVCDFLVGLPEDDTPEK